MKAVSRQWKRLLRVVEIVNEGADFIDIGAYSSRPNADHVSLEEEMNRLRMGLDDY